MKPITFTGAQRLRLTLILKDHVGTRKDAVTRLLSDVEERIGFSDEEMGNIVKPISEGRVMIDEAALNNMPASEFLVTKSESRALLDKLNAAPLSTRDLRTWADPLATALESVAGA